MAYLKLIDRYQSAKNLPFDTTKQVYQVMHC